MNNQRWRRVPIACALFDEWQRLRGARITEVSVAFGQSWETLLQKAGADGNAALQREAQNDAEELQAAGLVELKREKGREHRLRRIVIPLAAEPRWRQIFDVEAVGEMLARAREVILDVRTLFHPVLAERWTQWCDTLLAKLDGGASLHPLEWQDAGHLQRDLTTLHGLTSRRWDFPTPVRTASTALGLGSKAIEDRQRYFETLLGQLFGSPMTLEDLGLADRSPLLRIAGPLVLRFSDGAVADLRMLRGVFAVSERDLERASQIETTALRLLTVENEKTPFHQLAACEDRSTLLVAGGQPVTALRLLLAKLPQTLPCWHFGDTDPSGFDILHALRRETARDIAAFQMTYRPSADSAELTAKDRSIIARLLHEELPLTERESITAIEAAGRKGLFEQECLGPPRIRTWPFY